MKATDIAAYALCALMLPVLHDALRADDPAPGWQQVRLRAGNTLEGRVVKRTAQTVFVDIGPTIVSIPAADVAEVIEPTKADAPDKAGDGGADAAAKTGADASRREAIFFTARLTPGSIEEKAREVGESVVHVLCLGGSGSGFVIDDEGGYVVTNYHVVEQERDISIAVYMREESGLRKVKIEDVEIVALNPFFDLALLRVDPPDGVTLRKSYLGDYPRVRAGDPVFAIGNPLGLDRTVSDGIVSNRKRVMRGQLAIQTTAAINPGNSGGPLFNDRGEVIGVTSSKILGGESLGFAIPIHYVKDFLRNRDAYAFDKDNPNTGVRYFQPPRKPEKKAPGKKAPAAKS